MIVLLQDDPEDSKPSDWVDNAKIPDPKAVKVRIFEFGTAEY